MICMSYDKKDKMICMSSDKMICMSSDKRDKMI